MGCSNSKTDQQVASSSDGSSKTGETVNPLAQRKSQLDDDGNNPSHQIPKSRDEAGSNAKECEHDDRQENVAATGDDVITKAPTINPNELFHEVGEDAILVHGVKTAKPDSQASYYAVMTSSSASPISKMSYSISLSAGMTSQSGSRRSSGNASLLGKSGSGTNGSFGKSATSLPAEGRLRPEPLPTDYLKRMAQVVAVAEASKRISTGLPRPEVPQAPSLPLHWASRFYPRKPGCLHDQHYNGVSIERPAGNLLSAALAKPYDVIIDTPSGRRIAQTQELILSLKFSGKAFAWPHPASAHQEELVLLPLGALRVEEVDLSDPIVMNPKKMQELRSICGSLKHLLGVLRKTLMFGDGYSQALEAGVGSLSQAAYQLGLTRLASVLLHIEAMIVDIQCLHAGPTQFLALVESSVGRHYIHEYQVDYFDPDLPPGHRSFRPPIEEYLTKRFLVDLSYCYQLIRKCYKNTCMFLHA